MPLLAIKYTTVQCLSSFSLKDDLIWVETCRIFDKLDFCLTKIVVFRRTVVVLILGSVLW